MLRISSKALTLTCFTIIVVNIDVFYVIKCVAQVKMINTAYHCLSTEKYR